LKLVARPAEAARFAGWVLLASGAWWHTPWLLLTGLSVIVLARVRGSVLPAPARPARYPGRPPRRIPPAKEPVAAPVGYFALVDPGASCLLVDCHGAGELLLPLFTSAERADRARAVLLGGTSWRPVPLPAGADRLRACLKSHGIGHVAVDPDYEARAHGPRGVQSAEEFLREAAGPGAARAPAA
jgi:hypothetical protein